MRNSSFKEALLRFAIVGIFFPDFFNLLSFYGFLELGAHIEIWGRCICHLWDALFLFGLFEPHMSISELRTALMILKISSLIIFRVNVVKYVIRIEIFTTKSQCFHSRTFLDALQLNGAYRCVIFERKYHVKLHQNK